MKTTFRFNIRSFALTVALSAGLSFVAPAFGQYIVYGPKGEVGSYLIDTHSGTATQLGNLGGIATVATDINDAGQVVGASTTSGNDPNSRHGFITGPDGAGMTDFGTLGGILSDARSINNAGQVVLAVGFRSSPTIPSFPSYFVTGPNGADPIRLPILEAHDINDSGQVAGANSHAAVIGPDYGGGVTDLGTLIGNAGDISVGIGINNAGQVVGWSDTAEGEVHAFVTGPNGVGMTDLGTLGGNRSTAFGINDAGQVVGWFDTAGDDLSSRRAFIAGPDGGIMTDLGTLGGSFSAADDINDMGQVVGYSQTAEGEVHAFITGPDGRGMTDLNSLVNLPIGQILTSATGINDLGQVIAVATIPEPESYALMLAGLALVGFTVRNRRQA